MDFVSDYYVCEGAYVRGQFCGVVSLLACYRSEVGALVVRLTHLHRSEDGAAITRPTRSHRPEDGAVLVRLTRLHRSGDGTTCTVCYLASPLL